MEMNHPVQIAYQPHPIEVAGRQHFDYVTSEGWTVREILLGLGLDPLQPVMIRLDGRLLEVEEWDLICPRQGQFIQVHATVQSGVIRAIKSVIRPIATVLVIAAAFLVAGPLASTYAAVGFGASAAVATAVGVAATAVTLIAGSAIISAVFPPQVAAVDTSYNAISTPNSPGTGISGGGPTPVASLGGIGISGSGNTSVASGVTSYSLSGGNNRIRPYESMPVVIGTHRFFPDAAVRPYSEYQGDDQFLYQIFNLGLQNGTFTDWKIGTNPIGNYTDYWWYEQNSNAQILEYPGNVDTSSGAALTASADWITRTTSQDTFRIAVDMSFILFYATNQGTLDSRSVSFEIQYKESSSSNWLSWGSFSESGRQQNPIRRSYTIDVAPGTYDVRIKRSTPDSSDARLKTLSTWDNLKSYQSDKASYIGQHRRGLKIKASEQLNGTVQQLSAICEAKAYYCYNGVWDWRVTSNPAHWFMHFAKGHYDSEGTLLYGVGLKDNQIDIALLTAWASFCTQESLSFNAVIDGSQTAADILTAIARCGFGSPSWASGKLGAIWDARNASPVAAFGMSNIIRDSFEVAYVTEELAEEIIVQYENPDNDWNRDEVHVLVPEITNPLRSSTIDLFGCTNAKMAAKFANYMAAQQYYRRRRITWETDLEGSIVNRGDVVLLSHDLTQWGYTGRVVSVDDLVLVLDRTVPRNGAVDYLMLRQPDGTMTTYTVQARSNDSDVITLTTPPEFQEGFLPMDHIWFFSPLPTPGKKVKILSVEPLNPNLIRMIATDEDEAFYRAWDNIWNPPTVNTLYANSTPKIANLVAHENLYLGSDATIKSHIVISWVGQGLYERANVKYRINNGPWIREFTSTGNTSYEFYTTEVGILEIGVIPIFGALQGPSTNLLTHIHGIEVPPEDVTNLTDFYRNNRTVLTWRGVSDPRPIDYEIRKGLTWQQAQVLQRTTNTEFTTVGDGTYWVAARTGTIYSENPESILIEGANLLANVIAEFDEELTGWTGSIYDGAYVVGTDVTLAGGGRFSSIPVVSEIPSWAYFSVIASSGYYEIPSDHIVDVGTAQSCNVAASYRMTANNPFGQLFSEIALVSAEVSITGNYAEFCNVNVEMAIAPNSGVFGEWQDFLPGSYIGRKFKFRVNLLSYDNTIAPLLDYFKFSVDMDDRVVSDSNISCPAGTGLTITYSPAFQIVPSVQITILDAVAGDDAMLTNQSEASFVLHIKNGNNDVTRSINWLSQGY
jgi:hypothetical protein